MKTLCYSWFVKIIHVLVQGEKWRPESANGRVWKRHRGGIRAVFIFLGLRTPRNIIRRERYYYMSKYKTIKSIY